MSTKNANREESTDSMDAFARELGYAGIDDCPPQVRRGIEASWPNVRVGSFQDLVEDLADSVEAE